MFSGVRCDEKRMVIDDDEVGDEFVSLEGDFDRFVRSGQKYGVSFVGVCTCAFDQF